MTTTEDPAADRITVKLVDAVERHLERLRRLRWCESRPVVAQVARGRDRGLIQSWRAGDDPRARTFKSKEKPAQNPGRLRRLSQ
jgi:hypothetical protein